MTTVFWMWRKMSDVAMRQFQTANIYSHVLIQNKGTESKYKNYSVTNRIAENERPDNLLNTVHQKATIKYICHSVCEKHPRKCISWWPW